MRKPWHVGSSISLDSSLFGAPKPTLSRLLRRRSFTAQKQNIAALGITSVPPHRCLTHHLLKLSPNRFVPTHWDYIPPPRAFVYTIGHFNIRVQRFSLACRARHTQHSSPNQRETKTCPLTSPRSSRTSSCFFFFLLVREAMIEVLFIISYCMFSA